MRVTGGRAAWTATLASVWLALSCVAVGPGRARAQSQGPAPETAFALSTPRVLSSREIGSRLSVPGLAPPPASTEPEHPASEWQGPRVELGYSRYRLSDGYGGGLVQGFNFGGYLPTGAARLGMYGELAVRDYSLGQTQDAIVRAAVMAGYQQWKGLGPFVPYVVAVGTGGVLFGKRYHTPVSQTLWGAGLELGADVALVRHLWAGASFSWLRITMRGLHWDLYLIRLRVGL